VQAELIGIVRDMKSKVLMLGAERQPNHTVETQLLGLADKLAELVELAEAIPSIGAHGDVSCIDMASIKVILGDHAADVVKRAKEVNKLRTERMHLELGAKGWLDLSKEEQANRESAELEKLAMTEEELDALSTNEQEDAQLKSLAAAHEAAQKAYGAEMLMQLDEKKREELLRGCVQLEGAIHTLCAFSWWRRLPRKEGARKLGGSLSL